jgi:hypothetical protein
MLKKQPAIYPMMKSDVKTFTIPAGSHNWTADDLYQGLVPTRVVVGMVSAAAYAGRPNKNPYNFTHFNCSSISFEVNNQSVPTQPFRQNYKNNLYVPAYLSLFTGLGTFNSNDGNYISRMDYPNGYNLWLFDIDGKRAKEYLNLMRKGHTRLSLNFSQPTPEAISVIVYSHFPYILQIDESRSVIV